MMPKARHYETAERLVEGYAYEFAKAYASGKNVVHIREALKTAMATALANEFSEAVGFAVEEMVHAVEDLRFKGRILEAALAKDAIQQRARLWAGTGGEGQ